MSTSPSKASSKTDIVAASDGTPKDIFTSIKEVKEKEKKAVGEVSMEGAVNECSVLIVGNKAGGKSSLILKFLDRDEKPNPTIGLEYTYGRRSRSTSATKDIAHLWELAGGASLSSLIDIPVNESNIHSSMVVIVADLSKPAEAIEIVQLFLERFHSRINELLDALEKRGSKRPKALRAFALKKYGAEHPDKAILTPIPVSLMIVGTKYDVFRDYEPDKRKLINRLLRWNAHTYGASLAYWTQKDESLMTKCRQLMNYYIFKTSLPKFPPIDMDKPLFVMAGTDDTLSIRGAMASDRSMNRAQMFDILKQDFQKSFGVKDEAENKFNIESELKKYPEAVIDSIRRSKLEELKRAKTITGRNSDSIIVEGLEMFSKRDVEKRRPTRKAK